MENNFSFLEKHKFLFSAIFALVVLAGLFLLVTYKNKIIIKDDTSLFSSKVLTNQYAIKRTMAGDLPEYFEKNFPLESGVKIDNSYNVSSAGSTQATINFESKKKLDDSFKIYIDYLSQKNGWTVLNIFNSGNIKSISALNEKGVSVFVNMAESALTKANQITISFVYENNLEKQK